MKLIYRKLTKYAIFNKERVEKNPIKVGINLAIILGKIALNLYL